MQKVDGISEQLDFFRHFSVKDKKYPVQSALNCTGYFNVFSL